MIYLFTYQVNFIVKTNKLFSTFRIHLNPLSPHDALLKHHFTSLKTGLIFLQIRALEFRIISMKLGYQYMAIFFNFQTTSNHLHPQQVENCDSNSRLVVDEDDNGKFRLERVKPLKAGKHLLCIDSIMYHIVVEAEKAELGQ